MIRSNTFADFDSISVFEISLSVKSQSNRMISIFELFSFQSIIDFLGYEELGNEFEEYFYRLCRDGDAKIRSTMSLTIIDVCFLFDFSFFAPHATFFQLSNFENQRDTTFNSILFNGFLTLLNDNHVDVMFSIAKNLLKIFQIFSRDPTDGLLNGSISSEASVR